MRFFLLLLFVVIATLFTPLVARAEATRSIDLHADVVDYYSNRFILTADGNVRLRLSDGTILTGNTFSMDLKLNRFLIAGNVHLEGQNVNETGAAFAGYPDLDRNYFLEEGDAPDRWTYFGQNFTDRHPGRQQPGDAFFFPDLSAEKPYIVADGATIFLKNNVEFPIGARIDILGVMLPTPGFVVNYSANSNFYQNAFSGATFDIGIPFHGAADALSAMHIRYDTYRGFYTSFDQHFVHNLDYAVFSVDPITQTQRQFNAILYKRISPGSEARLFYQLSTNQNFPYQPWIAADYANFVFNTRLGKYAIGLNADQFNNSLLPDAQNAFAANGLRQAGHPFDMTLTVQSFEDEIRFFRRLGVPIKFQYRAGYGYNYDSYGLPTLQGYFAGFNGAQYDYIGQTFLGATVYTSSIRIAKQTTISAKIDKLEQWYTLPHHTITTDATATIAYTPTSVKRPAFYLAYEIYNLGDYYGAQQRDAYPAAANAVLSTCCGVFTGLAAFEGLATQHATTGSMVYTPTAFFNFNVTAQHFQNSVPGIPGYGGQPPNQVTLDARLRLAKQILVDVGRSYYFNWGGLKWSPQYTLQFSP